MKKLDGLTYTPTWISHMGCLSGCTRHLSLPATDSWLYGATGHAFIINISRDSCPSGPTAYTTWADGIQDASAIRDGAAYNAQCWRECRHHAAAFLEEAKARLPHLTAHLDAAKKHYTEVAANLKTLTEIYPFTLPPDFEKPVPEDETQQQALTALGNAREAEEAGLESLKAILEELP